MAGDVSGIEAGPRRCRLENRRDRIAMQPSGGYVAVTIDCAKDGALGNVGSGKPLAKRLYWASLLVLAKRDGDLIAGLLLVGFRTRYVDHESGVRKAQVAYRHRTEFRPAKRACESNQTQSPIAQAEKILRA